MLISWGGVTNFNPRSREGSDGLREPRAKQPVHFNPRSREGSDHQPQRVRAHRSISIHAPAKGATLYALHNAVRVYISIHAPAKGATQNELHFSASQSISIHAPAKGATNTSYLLCRAAGFQSTLPRRERQLLLACVLEVRVISIHAPAKGATSVYRLIWWIRLFQSTLPRRERPRQRRSCVV